jgi:DNA-binding transcriptional regulator YdaS (Cro superfamily)
MAKTVTLRRTAGPARKSAKVAPRKPAGGKPAAAPAPATKLKIAAKPKAAPKAQRFVASHPDVSPFVEGLRSYAAYRDLGIARATDGMVQAHVIRFIPPCRPEEVSKLHYHDVEFQMVYVLKGWIKSEFEGEGVQKFEAGACWIQPPRIKHKVLDYSGDCEVLEIILPAEFDTVTLD